MQRLLQVPRHLRHRCESGRDSTSIVLTEQTSRSLERSLQVALGGSTKDMDGDRFRLDEVLEGHETLDEKWLSVLHVAVQERHHEYAHVDSANQLRGLRQVIIPNGSRYKSSRFRRLPYAR